MQYIQVTRKLRIARPGLPDLVSEHINACVLMMAERMSDVIRGKPMLHA